MIDISVVIPTYNRKLLLDRCIKSAIANGIIVKNIIVIDDASTDETELFIQQNYPNITYHKFNKNKGVCCARNYGLQICKTHYGLLLDSDDQLCEDAIKVVSGHITDINKSGCVYSAYYFLRDKAKLNNTDIRYLTPEHIINNCITGNATEVIDITNFKNHGYLFPENVSAIGGEHLLWLEIAKRETIPITNKVITIENDDANNRLTSVFSQIKKARYHAISQEETIEKFGDLYLKYNKNEYNNRLYACSIYYKLSGNFPKALSWAIKSLKQIPKIKSVFPLIFAFMPQFLAKKVFIRWRGSQ